MATVNFLYRSTKKEAPLNVRLLFRLDGVDYVVGGKSPLIVSYDYWKNTHSRNIKHIRDVQKRNLYIEVNQELSDLQDFILTRFRNSDPTTVNKEWLKSTISAYYNPNRLDSNTFVSDDLLSNFDRYIMDRQSEITKRTVMRLNTTKTKVERFQTFMGRTYLIKDVDNQFKNEFIDYCTKEGYSRNTQQKEFAMIKGICKNARKLGVETYRHLDDLSIKKSQVKHIYLTLKDIDRIREAKLNEEHLGNARDWLLISCYTGQRISDFMNFTKEMIRVENGKSLLEFQQFKTKKQMSIPLPKEVRRILEARLGEFPRAISDQKYNDYIKIVGKKAGLKEKCTGKRRINVTPNDEKATYRDVVGLYEKWELITSHIGRRSFASNNYGKIPTSYLIHMTGHGSEKMFLSYIKKSSRDIALDAYDYFD